MIANKKEAMGNQYEPEEFIPFACHYNPHTLLTKNGELMQVIRITGFENQQIKEEKGLSLRETIRSALKKNIESEDIAIWFHTIRRVRDISLHDEYENSFAQELNKKWNSEHSWNKKYVNELFISFLIEGEHLQLGNISNFLRTLNYPREISNRTKYLDNSCRKLTELVENVLSDLGRYGAKRLEIYKNQDDGVYYSEITSFLSKIVNLRENQIPLAFSDLSQIICTHKFRAGFNTIELKEGGKKNYGALFTIKEYHETETKQIDKILQLPLEFIITESFDFIEAKTGSENYKRYKYYYEISGDEELYEKSGLKGLVEAEKHGGLKFGKHQLTLMLINNDVKELKKKISYLVKAFHELGIVIIREDIFLEDCYWAQLPSNFAFLKRMSSINLRRTAGYASLSNYAAGQKHRNHWGDAITILNTDSKTPYFFNFHVGGNGHTLIAGPDGSGKTALLNFLITQTLKFDPNIFFFDDVGSSELFFHAIDGEYLQNDEVNNFFAKSNKVGIYIKNLEDRSDFLVNSLNKIEQSLDGTKPTIIVLDEAWKEIEDQEFTHKIDSFLRSLSQKNAIVIFSTQTVSDAGGNKITREIINNTATQIYFPNKHAGEGYKDTFAVSDLVTKKLRKIENKKRKFVLKHGNELIIVRLNLKMFQNELRILSASSEDIITARKIIKESKNNWMEKFFNN